jgi:TRAP-type uncharacterized transport system substrate-binding protein
MFLVFPMSEKETTLKPTRMRTHPHTTRSRLMLEVASRLVDRSRDFPYLQTKISLREQGSAEWPLTLFASDSPATIHEVAAGRVQFAMINPGMILKVAALGRPPFKEPIPLRIVAILPALDQMVFAVKQSTGLKTFTDIRDRKYPLKVSLRGQPDHSLHLIINHVLAAAGFSLDDIVSWGGQVRYDAGMAYGQNRIGAVERGEIEAIFDEGASAWGNMALESGMTFLSLDETVLQRLENVGLRRGLLERNYFTKLASDIPTLDFSGWPIYTHASTADTFVSDFCQALEASKDKIPWAKDETLPLAQMVRDSAEGHLEVPLHPAAEHYWREHGFL